MAPISDRRSVSARRRSRYAAVSEVFRRERALTSLAESLGVAFRSATGSGLPPLSVGLGAVSASCISRGVGVAKWRDGQRPSLLKRRRL